MFGRHVEVVLSPYAKATVWISCTPKTPMDELQRRAKAIMKQRLENE